MDVIILLALAVFLSCQEPCIQEPAKELEPSASELSLEVNALQLLYDLQLSNPQLEKLRKWAGETAQKARPRKDIEVSKDLRAKLTQLHKALAEATDGEEIDKLATEVEDLRSKENPILDDKVDLSPAARKRIPDLFRILQPKQAAALLALDGEGIADPRQKLKEALEDVRDLEAEEWKAQRDVIAGEISRLVAGINTKKYEQLHDGVIILLVKARKLDQEDFQAERRSLEREASKLIGDPGAVDILRNYLEYNLAELLSNPRLSAALTARLK